jgi:1-acyl-sn-glycerol-3-phosphate acyltransferase
MSKLQLLVSFPLRLVYGTYALLAFLTCATVTLAALTLIPGVSLTARRGMAHAGARAFFALAGIPIRMRGLEHLPSGACVLVANHASYLDGVLLKAMLPARFCFVIKKEIVRVPLAATLLRRIGSEFVDRFNRHAGAMDARRLIKAASTGQALVFFPEGTFSEAAGLARFHSGAFATAARAQVPVVPLAIRGTRHVLPAGQFLPAWGRIEIIVLEPINETAEAHNAQAADLAKRTARERILSVLGEPDLAETDAVAALDGQRRTMPGPVAE